MNTITEKLSKVFTEKQIQVLKDAWRYGQWGDSMILFADGYEAWGLGACTNDAKKGGHFTGRQISGIMSGISKNVDSTHTSLVEVFPDWWGDGTGSMVFFNIDALGYEDSSVAWDELDKWAKSDE